MIDFTSPRAIQRDLDAARHEIKLLRKALNFYADEKKYEADDYVVNGYTRPIMRDHGETARAALKPS